MQDKRHEQSWGEPERLFDQRERSVPKPFKEPELPKLVAAEENSIRLVTEESQTKLVETSEAEPDHAVTTEPASDVSIAETENG